VEWNNGVTTAKYAYIQDLQGDIVGIVDGNGTEVVKYIYDAWGKLLSTTGSLAATLGTIQPFRYRGYVYDVETGLYHLRSRHYQAEWSRFINADDTSYAYDGDNYYTYCLNDPVDRDDPDGTNDKAIEVVLDGGIGGAYLTIGIFAATTLAYAYSETVSLCDQSTHGNSVLSRYRIIDEYEIGIALIELIAITENHIYDPNPYGRAGEKDQNRENRNKNRTKKNFKPRNNRRDGKPRPPKRHTPGRDHRKYTILIPVFEPDFDSNSER